MGRRDSTPVSAARMGAGSRSMGGMPTAAGGGLHGGGQGGKARGGALLPTLAGGGASNPALNGVLGDRWGCCGWGLGGGAGGQCPGSAGMRGLGSGLGSLAAARAAALAAPVDQTNDRSVCCVTNVPPPRVLLPVATARSAGERPSRPGSGRPQEARCRVGQAAWGAAAPAQGACSRSSSSSSRRHSRARTQRAMGGSCRPSRRHELPAKRGT